MYVALKNITIFNISILLERKPAPKNVYIMSFYSSLNYSKYNTFLFLTILSEFKFASSTNITNIARSRHMRSVPPFKSLEIFVRACLFC